MDPEFLEEGKIRVIELVMPRKDAPRVCHNLTKGFAQANRGEAGKA